MRKPIRIHIKNLLASFLYWSGYVWLQRQLNNLRGPSIRILCYHSINKPTGKFFSLAHRMMVSPEKFKGQLEYVHRKYPTLSEEKLVEKLKINEDLREDCVLITLDDGYRDNLENALPLLRSFKIPAVVFVSGRDDEQEDLRWWHDLILIVDGNLASEKGSSNDSKASRSYWERHSYLSTLSSKQRGIQLDSANQIEVLDQTPNRLKFLNFADINIMQQYDVSFGAHTLHHPNLLQISEDDARKEITESIESLSKRLGKPVKGFAYPFGKKDDFTESTKSILLEAGVRYAVTTEWGLNRRIMDPLSLGRVVIDGTDSKYSFICKVEGIFRT